MKPISKKVVDETWQKMNKIAAEKAPELIEKMKAEQPSLLVFLMAVDADILNDDERELLLYLGMVVWQIMLRGNKSLKEVPEEVIFEKEDSNIAMLDYLEDEPDFDETMMNIMENYNQKEVLCYVVEALMEPDEEGVDLSEDGLGALFISLKTVIDCLDQ